MTTEELKKTYSAFSTKELLEIVDSKFDYTELAVSIALAELSTRQISENDIKIYKEEQLEKAMTFIRRNISDDLTFFQKNLFYFIWFPFINFAFKQNFRYGGYILKLKQTNYYSLLGFVFFMVVGFTAAMYDHSILTSLAIWIIGFLPSYAFDETFNRKNQIKRLKTLYGSPESKVETQTSEEQNSL